MLLWRGCVVVVVAEYQRAQAKGVRDAISGGGSGGGDGGGQGSKGGGGGSVGAQHIFTALLHLRRLCNHPLLALAHQPELRKQAG